MRIVLLTDFLYPRYGGISTHVEGLVKALIREGHKAIVITTAGDKRGFDKLDDMITVYRDPAPVLTTLIFNIERLKKRIESVIGKIDPDILHAHHAFSPMGIITPEIGKKLGIPTVLTNHSVPFGFYVARYQWYTIAKLLATFSALRSLRMYDRVIAVSPVAAEFISKFYRGKIHIIPNAIHLDEFDKIEASKEELGLNKDEPLILMVGRASLKKGFELALLAFKKVVDEVPNARLFIVGLTGFLRSYINGLVKFLKLEENVYIPGYVPRETLIKFYKAADVFIHTAYGGESFGIVLIEAMAAGTPIVSTAGDGLKHVLENSGAAICLDVPNPSTLAKAILKLLNDEDMRRSMSIAGRKYVKKYSWSRIVKRIIEIYNQLVENS